LKIINASTGLLSSPRVIRELSNLLGCGRQLKTFQNAFADEKFVRDKILWPSQDASKLPVYSGKRPELAGGPIDAELSELGLSDELLLWTKGVLADEE